MIKLSLMLALLLALIGVAAAQDIINKPRMALPSNVALTPVLSAGGPSSGTVNVASANFTVTLANATFNGAQTVTIGDGAQGGTLTPSVGSPGTSSVVVTPSNGASNFTFTYTPVTTGAITLTFSNAQAWTNPAPLSYTSNAAGGGQVSLVLGIP